MTSVSSRRWWLPSVSQMIWIVPFLGLFLSHQRLDMINADGDVCWHLRSGQWMLEHREVMRIEQFLHTRAGAPVYTHDWLSELGFAVMANAFGWNGVTLLAAALVATALWLLHRQLLAEGNGLLLATGIVLLISTAVSIHWLARPLLVTHLLVVLFAWRLRAFDRDELPSSQLFVTLVPLMVLWVNSHGAFLVGVVLIGMYLVGNLIEWTRSTGETRLQSGRKAKALLFLAVACTVATLANPNGWRLPAHIVQFLGLPLLNAVTFEFRSPDFHNGRMTGFLLIWLAFLLVFAIARPRLRATDMILLGGWTFLSLRTLRNVPVFAFVVAPILAEHLRTLTGQHENSPRLERIRRLSALLMLQDRSAGRWLWIVLCLAVVLFTLSVPNGFVPHTTLSPESFPIKAVEFLRVHPDAVHGEMFNDYDWGGYLMLAMPERKAFIDGRNDIYGEELLREYLRIVSVHPKWEEVIEKYGVGWVIVPSNKALATYLALRSDWKPVYIDSAAAIFAKR
jgi:hypothetical protein